MRFISIALILVSFVFAQQGWFWQNPTPHGNGINDIQMIDSNLAFAVGKQGTIIRTDDGGFNWTLQFTDTTKALLGLYFYDSNTGTVVGEDGIIMKTVNGGQNWTRQQSGVTTTLRAVFFETADIGIAVGDAGVVLKTGNGGDTWNRVNIENNPTMDLFDVKISKNYADIIIIGDDGTMIRTNLGDIGIVETSAVSISADFASLRALHYITDTPTKTWICVGLNGTVMRTLDNGDSWSPIDLPNINGRDLYDISFGTDTHGMIVGENGLVYLSEDGGDTWVEEEADSRTLNGLWALDMNVAMAVGDSGAVLNTLDGGVNWLNKRSSVSAQDFTSAHIVDDLNAFAVNAAGDLFYTEDGGENWLNNFNVTILSNGSVLEAVRLFNNTGIAVGEDGLILRSLDGGDSWSKVSGVTSNYLYDVGFLSDQVVCFAGASGEIFRSEDGGANWSEAGSENTVFDHYALDFADANVGVAVGMFGTIVRSTDQGRNWVTIDNDGAPYTTKRLYDVDFGSADVGAIVGQDGTLLRSEDGGLTWSFVMQGEIIQDLLAVQFTNSTTAYAVGDSGLVLRSTDSGQSWQQQLSRCTEKLSDIFFLDNYDGIVVGDNGTILRTNDGGLPVELVAFNADVDAQGVLLQWRTASEQNNYGFEIQRRFDRPAAEWQTIAFVSGSGTTADPRDYRYNDDIEALETIYYRLVQIDLDGSTTYSRVLRVNRAGSLPLLFSLHPNYPNPFNASTTIGFTLSQDSRVTLSIYNNLGQVVDVLADGYRNAGRYNVIWDASPFPSGIYYCILRAGGQTSTQKLLYLR